MTGFGQECEQEVCKDSKLFAVAARRFSSPKFHLLRTRGNKLTQWAQWPGWLHLDVSKPILTIGQSK